MLYNRPYINKKVTVIIPCKNRDLSLFQVLPHWFCQIKKAQIVIVDYDSRSSLYTLVREICNRHKRSLAYDQHHSDADCVILPLKNKVFFNMSHAINYAITKTTSDVISIAGCESLPAPYYLEIACNIIDDYTFTRCIRGRLTYPRRMIEKINGYPELMEYWGGEDDLVAYQMVRQGARCVDMDYLMVRNMQTANFHDPIPGYSNIETSLTKHFSEQDPSIEFRNNLIANKLEGVKKNKQAVARYIRDYGNDCINNYGQHYGGEEPVLLNQKSATTVIDVLPEVPRPFVNNRNVNKRCAVIIAVGNRLDNIRTTLPMWLLQLYQNKQIVIIDYSSDEEIKFAIENICEGHKMSVSYNEFRHDADVVLFRVEKQKYFNISHAYNYAVSRIEADVLSFVCADTCPVDYYLDLVMHAVDDESIIQMWWGLLTISYENWKKLNGHQEFNVGWGAEDTDFKDRALMIGLSLVHFSENYAFHIPQDPSFKGSYRQIKDIYHSNAINTARFAMYRAIIGYVGNYNKPIGQEVPIEYMGEEKELHELHVFDYIDVDPRLLPEIAKLHKESTYFVVMNPLHIDDQASWADKWQEWMRAGKLKSHIKEFVSDVSEDQISKIVTNIKAQIDKDFEKRRASRETIK